MTAGYTRRGLLRAGGLGSLGLVAGCLGDGDASTSPADPPANSPFEEIAVDGSDLVVQLRDGHAVSKLNLIGPGGNAIAETEVARGTSTARLQLLDVRPDVGGYELYEPGTHELVAVTESGSLSIEVELVPELRIDTVEQYRDGDQPADLGKVAVTIENIGSGPTWVYDITYRGAPNDSANTPLVPDPGVPQLEKPENPVISPDERRKYVSSSSPFNFSDRSDSPCKGTLRFRIVIGVPGSNPLEKRLTATLGGDTRAIGLVDNYTCSRISLNLDSGQK